MCTLKYSYIFQNICATSCPSQSSLWSSWTSKRDHPKTGGEQCCTEQPCSSFWTNLFSFWKTVESWRCLDLFSTVCSCHTALWVLMALGISGAGSCGSHSCRELRAKVEKYPAWSLPKRWKLLKGLCLVLFNVRSVANKTFQFWNCKEMRRCWPLKKKVGLEMS